MFHDFSSQSARMFKCLPPLCDWCARSLQAEPLLSNQLRRIRSSDTAPILLLSLDQLGVSWLSGPRDPRYPKMARADGRHVMLR